MALAVTAAFADGVRRWLAAGAPTQPPTPAERLVAFDAFRFCDQASAQGRCPLAALAAEIFGRRGFFVRGTGVCVEPGTLERFCASVWAGMPNNGYHNAVHVTDVVAKTDALLHAGGLDEVLQAWQVLAVLVAAIVHDFEHRGLSNGFLETTADSWVAKAGDGVGPNESHHAMAAEALLGVPGTDVLAGIDSATGAKVRQLVTDLITATDMAQHGAIVAQLGGQLPAEVAAARLGRGLPLRDASATLLLKGLLKTADLGHCYAAPEVHRRWAHALEEEIFRQGDREREMGLQISFGGDRAQPGITAHQEGFFVGVIFPLLTVWTDCVPGCPDIVAAARANLASWSEPAHRGA